MGQSVEYFYSTADYFLEDDIMDPEVEQLIDDLFRNDPDHWVQTLLVDF